MVPSQRYSRYKDRDRLTEGSIKWKDRPNDTIVVGLKWFINFTFLYYFLLYKLLNIFCVEYIKSFKDFRSEFRFGCALYEKR